MLMIPCMHIKFVTLRVIWTLGGQLYILNVLSPPEIGCMDLDIEGLDESLIRLDELGRSFPNLF